MGSISGSRTLPVWGLCVALSLALAVLSSCVRRLAVFGAVPRAASPGFAQSTLPPEDANPRSPDPTDLDN